MAPGPRRLIACWILPTVLASAFIASTEAARPAISAGGVHNLALGSDGFIRAWGDDSAGELGTGRPIDATTPLRVINLPPVVAISAGANHTLAVGADGAVYGWGSNYLGEVVNGTSTLGQPLAARIPTISEARAVSGGWHYSLALTRDGSVYSWGGNSSGQLGDGTRTDRGAPVRVGGLPRVTAIAAGAAHTLALAEDGSVWSWGYNESGELGDGTQAQRSTPARVEGIGPAIAVCAGAAHSVAVEIDGRVVAWGRNDAGQLGDGTTATHSLRPVRVVGLTGIVEISCNHSNSNAARAADGSVWTWGANWSGALGDGTTTNRAIPARVGGLPPIATVSATGGTHMLAVTTTRGLWSWGENSRGYLGDGTFVARRTPGTVPGLSDVIAVSGGQTHSVTLRADGSVWAFGNNWYGQLGDGAPQLRTVPFHIPSLSDVVGVAAGYGLSVAVRSDGSVWAWGNNSAGNCGDGTTIDRSTPVRVLNVPASQAVTAGVGHGAALARDGTVWTWGWDSSGQLGRDGDRLKAGRVEGIADVVQVSAGSEFTLALKGDGTVWAWGANGRGQLGNGTYDSRRVPALVPGLSDVIAISAGAEHAAALKRDGTIWTWGENSSGQLGDGSSALTRPSPAPVPELGDAIEVSAGLHHSVALTRDRSVWVWGGNRSGELGDGSTSSRGRPTRLAEPGMIASVSAGNHRNFYGDGHTLALAVDGILWAWGNNYFGELGDGTLVKRPLPAVVLREDGAGGLATNDWFLDLDPASPSQVPSSKIPAFTLLTSSIGANIDALLRFRARDIGTTQSIFVFAAAPANLVRGGASPMAVKVGVAQGAAAKAETPIGCVLAQLTAAGQMVAVTSSSLAAYLTGVLSAQGLSVSILNGVPIANVTGATFFVGYGSNGSGMIEAGTNRAAVTVPGSLECRPSRPQTGWWWNPAEDGRGFSLEVRGYNMFFASFLYDASGRSTWYVSSGPVSLDGALYNGDLLSARGGQTLAGPYRGFPTLASVGTINLTFNNESTGTLVWPGGTVPIQRFNILPDGLALPGVPGQPESGWWWNEQESGRGFFMEFQNGWLDIAGYMYDDDGNPVWYLTVGQISGSDAARAFSGAWWSYRGGQTLTGPWRAHTRSNANVAPLTITFTGADSATMTLPGNRVTTLRRHRF